MWWRVRWGIKEVSGSGGGGGGLDRGITALGTRGGAVALWRCASRVVVGVGVVRPIDRLGVDPLDPIEQKDSGPPTLFWIAQLVLIGEFFGLDW